MPHAMWFSNINCFTRWMRPRYSHSCCRWWHSLRLLIPGGSLDLIPNGWEDLPKGVSRCPLAARCWCSFLAVGTKLLCSDAKLMLNWCCIDAELMMNWWSFDDILMLLMMYLLMVQMILMMYWWWNHWFLLETSATLGFSIQAMSLPCSPKGAELLPSCSPFRTHWCSYYSLNHLSSGQIEHEHNKCWKTCRWHFGWEELSIL